MKVFGKHIMIISALFIYGETVYFGNNLFPKSNLELVLDISGVIGFILGFILYIIGRNK